MNIDIVWARKGNNVSISIHAIGGSYLIMRCSLSGGSVIRSLLKHGLVYP